jgi:hypothetical protein
VSSTGNQPTGTALRGEYYGERDFALPNGWAKVPEPTLKQALEQTMVALRPDDAMKRLREYYDPNGGYSGATFLGVEPNDPDTVTAADLWAVTTLSVPIDVRQGRRLLQDRDVRGQVNRQLANLPASLPITDLEALEDPDGRPVLEVMWDLYDTFRTLLAAETPGTNRWVFAAKMCARKRPLLFPVRDEEVCSYLAGRARLKRGDGQLGQFHADIQVFAYLMTHDWVRQGLQQLWDAAAADGLVVDEPHLRLLDALLWTQAVWRKGAAAAGVAP